MYCNCEISMVRAINLHSFLHCLDHRHLSLTTAGMSTTCLAGHVASVESRLSSPRPAPRTGESRQNHDLHLWNLHDMHNQDVDHLINGLQLENLYVFLNSQDHGDLHLRTTEMTTTSSTNCNCGASTVFCTTTPPNPGIATIFSISCNCGISTTTTTSI